MSLQAWRGPIRSPGVQRGGGGGPGGEVGFLTTTGTLLLSSICPPSRVNAPAVPITTKTMNWRARAVRRGFVEVLLASESEACLPAKRN